MKYTGEQYVKHTAKQYVKHTAKQYVKHTVEQYMKYTDYTAEQYMKYTAKKYMKTSICPLNTETYMRKEMRQDETRQADLLLFTVTEYLHCLVSWLLK